ncbi:unnamed protein product [Spodoptera exigua]|nr:unnamed protein product [Spodoptera exigua]
MTEAHGPPKERDSEDIAMGRKLGAKWCSMAKVCNHDRVPICGVSHAGDIVGFRDLCDMFDYNCIRRRNGRQPAPPCVTPNTIGITIGLQAFWEFQNFETIGWAELKKACDNACECFHDTVIVCGKSVNEARTFLDLCDLYEYSCEHNMVFRHVKDEEGVCPDPRNLQRGK